MKVAILAGGFGTRLSEETINKPKPMVEIGEKPMLWHIMKIYAHYGYNEFVIALGYKGDIIKDYFLNYHFRENDLIVDIKKGNVTIGDGNSEEWVVHLVETGLETQTGGRVKKLANYIQEPFLLTYGDGVANVDIDKLVEFHKFHKCVATVTAVRPPARFGAIQFDGDHNVRSFEEKPQVGEGWINGGFFVLEHEIVNYIDDDMTVFEREPLENLAAKGELVAFKHFDFWQMMDTLRDLRALEKMWGEKTAPWKVW